MRSLHWADLASPLTQLEKITISMKVTRKGESLIHDTMRDEDLAWLAHLSRVIWLQGIRGVGDAGMKHLAGLTEMERLNIGGPGLTDAGLAYLTNMKKLNHLTVEGDIIDRGLQVLEGFPEMGFLNVQSKTACSQEAIERLKAKLPKANIKIVP